MAYTVLARKYRSQTFDDVVGQDPIAQTLKNAIRTHRVAHAYLFTGTRGVGKTTMARILAKALNCLSVDEPTAEPCCKCESCVAVNLGDDIDVIEIDGASNNGVEEVRRLRENAIYSPARARFKIYIIDEVHMLSTSAFNALLKILEEPPDHVKFIFATTEPNKVIATVQSRCQRFDFASINPSLIARQLTTILEAEGIKHDEDLPVALAKMANGSMRDGLSLLDRLISTGTEPLTMELLEQFLGCPNSERLTALVAKLGDHDAAGTLQAIDDLVAGGISEVQIVDSLIEYMRDLMVIKSAGGDTALLILTAAQRKQAAELAEKFDIAGIIYAVTALERLRWQVKNSDTPRALAEALCLRLALSEHFLNVDQLLGSAGQKPTKTSKKNAPLRDEALGEPQESAPPAQIEQLPQLTDLESLKANWQGVLGVITARLGNGTAGPLKAARPVSFVDGVLTLAFDGSARMSKRICESSERFGKIQSVFTELCAQPIVLQLEIAQAAPDEAAAPASDKTKTAAQIRNEILSEPAVRTVLTELGATVTGIEQCD